MYNIKKIMAFSKSTKQELDKLLEKKGHIKGVFMQTDAKYVIENEGQDGLLKLEKKVKELGYPLDYRKARAMTWYPIGLRPISLILMKEVFGWNDRRMRKLGKTAPKNSFIIKLFVKFLTSLEKLVNKIPDYYRMQYDIGKLEVTKFDNSGREIILKLTGLELHPLVCLYLEGYFEGVAHFAISGNPECKETKCFFRGDPYDEFKITW